MGSPGECPRAAQRFGALVTLSVTCATRCPRAADRARNPNSYRFGRNLADGATALPNPHDDEAEHRQSLGAAESGVAAGEYGEGAPLGDPPLAQQQHLSGWSPHNAPPPRALSVRVSTYPRPSSRTLATSASRSAAPSLARSLRRWYLIVDRSRPRRVAICWFDRPSASRAASARSRYVSS